MVDDSQNHSHLVPRRFSRRSFVRAMLTAGALGAGAAVLFEVASQRSVVTPNVVPPRLDPQLRSTLAAAQALVLPSEPNAPGSSEVGATDYLEMALGDPRVDEDDKRTVLVGAEQLGSKAHERFGTHFAALPLAKQTELLNEHSRDDDGREWLSVLVVFTLEALLSDPVYGGNREGAGWRWLGVSASVPRPAAPWQVALAKKAP